MVTTETLNPYQFNFSLHRAGAEPYSLIFAKLHKSLLSLNGLKQHNFSSHHRLTFLADDRNTSGHLWLERESPERLLLSAHSVSLAWLFADLLSNTFKIPYK